MDKNKKIIELKNISKSYDGTKVLDNIHLDIYDNEFLTPLRLRQDHDAAADRRF